MKNIDFNMKKDDVNLMLMKIENEMKIKRNIIDNNG